MTVKYFPSYPSAITRRNFLRILYSGLLSLSMGCTRKKESPPDASDYGVHFHMIADAHISSRHSPDKPSMNELFNDPLRGCRDIEINSFRLIEAIRRFNEDVSADFLIQLGDLKDIGKGIPLKTTTSDILSACKILGTWIGSGSIYHVVGNHDLEMSTKFSYKSSLDWETYINALETAGHNPDKRMNHPLRNNRGYYSWEIDNFLFIVVDCNGGWDTKNNITTTYYNGSPHYTDKQKIETKDANPENWKHMRVSIHKDQLDWIAGLLRKNKDKNIIFFSHHCLGPNDNYIILKHKDLKPDRPSDYRFFIQNHQAFHDTILNNHPNPNKIVCFCGHAHPGAFNDIKNNIRYYNIRGMTLGTVNTALPGHGPWKNISTGKLKYQTKNPFGTDGTPHHNSFCTVYLKEEDAKLKIRIYDYGLPVFYYPDALKRKYFKEQKMLSI